MRSTTFFRVKVVIPKKSELSFYSIDALMHLILTRAAEQVGEDVNFDEAQDASVVGSSVFDPYEIVYSNIPNSTHTLKHVANCKHCDAKKFEYETKSFCCQNGKIKLANPEAHSRTNEALVKCRCRCEIFS